MDSKQPDQLDVSGEPPSPGAAAPVASEPSSGETVAEREEPKFPIVGIGASAGGLEPLETLTRHLSANGMAFVILQHLAPGHESALTDILARGASMEVVTVRDGTKVEPNRIYVAPPNVDVALHRGVLRLMPPGPDRRGPRVSIDSFFRSLAADQGSTAIGVVLSGAGLDGTLGLCAIKEEGGITFAQDPATANQPSMPQSALDAGCVDICLTPAEIGDELTRLSNHPYIARGRAPKVIDEDTRSKLFVLLRGAFGLDFAAYKQSTIERRIQRRMALHKLDSLEDYLKYVQSNADELGVLYSDLLISVTAFFRDREPFEALRSVVFPRIVENRSPDVPIRIWVPGCATGEEAYSIAIALLEYLGDRAAGYKVQIFATDVDEQSLGRARLAVYPRNIEADVSPERLERFFGRTAKGYQVIRAVRDMVVFARHNIGKDPPFSRIDLVSCRNVLIYMQPPLQRKVLRILHYALNPDAFLLLGTSESVGEGSDLFALVDRKTKLYTKKNIPTSAVFDISFSGRPESDDARAHSVEHRPPIGVLQLADRKVLDLYGPPGVVVNDKLDILQYRAKTGRFFEPAPGVATINLLKLARPELLPELRSSLQTAIAGNTRVQSGPVRMWHEKELTHVRFDVMPLSEPGATERTFLVLFDEQRPDGRPSEEPPHVEAELADTQVRELERELATTKEYLQTTIEELEATNEELQSSNEELQSSNEELQSTNEEIETSKEELQSTNEELMTLNEELQNRMEQLNVTNDDLQNVLAAATSAIILVGMDLRIRCFSAAAEKLLNLIPGDVGRSIAYIRTVMRARDVEQTVSDVINSISSTEQRVRCADGYWYIMRISPYRTADHAIRGAVIELAKALPGEREEEPRELRGLGAAILASVPEGLAVIDEKMCIRWGNTTFLNMFHIEADIFGRPLEDLWSGKLDQPDIWKLLEDAAIDGRAFRKVSSAKPFGEPLNQPVIFSAHRLPNEYDHQPLTLLIVEKAGKGDG